MASTDGDQFSTEVIFFGNPLMDLTLPHAEDSFLEKYGLKCDEQREVDAEVIDCLVEEVVERSGFWGCGGSAASSARLLASLGRSVAFCGGVGRDSAADLFRRSGHRPGLTTCLQERPDYSTGRCVSLVTGIHRTLVANIGAARHFTADYLETPDMISRLQCSRMIYIEGFFLENRFEVCKYLLEKYSTGKYFCFNLSAPYVIHQQSESALFVAENSDVVIGNAKEFKAFGSKFYSTNDATESATRLHETARMNCSKSKSSKDSQDALISFGKCTVITEEDKDVIVVYGSSSSSVLRCPIDKLLPEQIVDTTGAGDAFAAGFLHAILKGADLQASVGYASKISARVIGVNGVPYIKDLPVFEKLKVQTI